MSAGALRAKPFRRYGRALVPTEEQEQAALVRWSALRSAQVPALALLYHVPNAGSKHINYAVRQKRQGLKSGVPDLCLPVARHGQHGLYVEMKKREGGKVSKAQADWHTRLRAEGYRVVVCEGWEAAQQAICEYLGIHP